MWLVEFFVEIRSGFYIKLIKSKNPLLHPDIYSIHKKQSVYSIIIGLGIRKIFKSDCGIFHHFMLLTGAQLAPIYIILYVERKFFLMCHTKVFILNNQRSQVTLSNLFGVREAFIFINVLAYSFKLLQKKDKNRDNEKKIINLAIIFIF